MTILKVGRPINKEKALAQIQDIEDPTVRMNVNIQKSFYKKIKQRALDENSTVTELVCKAVREYISK